MLGGVATVPAKLPGHLPDFRARVVLAAALLPFAVVAEPFDWLRCPHDVPEAVLEGSEHDVAHHVAAVAAGRDLPTHALRNTIRAPIGGIIVYP